MYTRSFTAAALAVSFSCPAAWAAGDAAKGAVVFHNHCDFCHSTITAEGDGDGPNLADVVGRKAGSMPEFEYSAAMKASGLTWNENTLGQFVQDPDKLVPGTKMARKFTGVSPDDVPDLIAYLQSKSPPAAETPPPPPADTGATAAPASSVPAPP